MSLETRERLPGSTTKHKSNHIDSEDIIDLSSINDLPYLKSINLVKYTPKHFGLERWKPLFDIDDAWMRRIYKHDVYKDTDLTESGKNKMTKAQRRILFDWLDRQRRMYMFDIKSHRTRRTKQDNLISYMAIQSDTIPDYESFENDDIEEPSRISTCFGHKVLPGEFIVRKALAKMNTLSDSDEKLYQELVQDKQFISMLKGRVGKYLKDNGVI